MSHFVLVERNRWHGSVYLSLHATVEAATDYHLGQESDEWVVERLVDLETGASFEPVFSLRWKVRAPTS
ncbi:hypothetical protein GCM10011354_30550 [Egicoccus halophilus]|uniref:Uncharacterized protein n=1 Tax=Egicoccus halophilus TaxID=1670830 RepID=A0A8J3AAL6_9ACTN|nr:hypothetical protein GCM10011354_30550 [Egicoccus halophilus]